MTKATATYPVSDHEWLSVKVMAEKDARIAELEAENERLTEALGKCGEKRAALLDGLFPILNSDIPLAGDVAEIYGRNGGGEQ